MSHPALHNRRFSRLRNNQGAAIVRENGAKGQILMLDTHDENLALPKDGEHKKIRETT